jgi:glyoxylase-like metal-dependent hydrolase (beta-lactamase superfamily II)
MTPARAATNDAYADVPRGRTARYDVLLEGSLTSKAGKVQSTCTLIRDEGRLMVVDPGMADDHHAIFEPLSALGFGPEQVTDVIVSHHHPDHTMRIALFPNAAVHDFWATYRGSTWEDADAEGRLLTPSVMLIRVPGHTVEDIAVVVGTPDGVAVCTHLWFDDEGPADDPTAEDPASLHASRRRVLDIADVIVPGHGAPFRPSSATPR